MKKSLLAAGLTLASTAAMAAPMTITDTYIGSDDHGYGDVIGHYSKFNIIDMVVDLVGTDLTVTINTTFANNGVGTYKNLTYNGKGIGFGDLFLADEWTPDTTVMPGYMDDDSTTGTEWDYALSLTDRWIENWTTSNTDQVALFYSLDSVSSDPTAPDNTEALLSDNFMKSGIYRNGQEVALNTASPDVTLIGAGNADINAGSPGSITFTVDIAGTSLVGADTIGLHWAMTCGNDTIEGAYSPVPAPAPLALLAIGLIGMAGFSRRRQI